MLNEHDKYEELASLAPLGELSQPEYEQFLAHLKSCDECRKTYGDASALAEAAFVVGSSTEEDRLVEDQRYRRSRQALARRLEPLPVQSPFRIRLAAVAAVSAIIIAFLVGFNVRAVVHPQSIEAQLLVPKSLVPPAFTKQLEPATSTAEVEHQLDIAQSEKRVLQDKLQQFGQALSALNSQVQVLTETNAKQQQEQRDTVQQLEDAKNTLARAQSTIQTDQALIASLQLAATSREARVSELETSLERERELLSAGREIRDIMGARDLHIVDVVDRDGKGRVRKAFGRAFYTQGKSLLFYAYDLPAKNTADGKFVYAAWGSNSNNPNRKAARSLGIFYNDDQAQHRWAMKFDDPKALEEIDTVFVTLEPADRPFVIPTGKPILDAYFGTPPNHP